jgi:hypothetical protein
LAQLFILAGLRRLGKTVELEARKMPIQTSILEHDVLGPVFQKGVQKGLQKGRQEGELTVLRGLIEKRFGELPQWAGEKLAALDRARAGSQERRRITEIAASRNCSSHAFQPQAVSHHGDA